MTFMRHWLWLITPLHRFIYRASRGWLGGRSMGFRFLLLEHVGRKSGLQRTTPILYVEDEGRFILAASNAGQDRHPAWWLNLQAHPEVHVQAGRRRVAVKARRASVEEETRLWPILGASWRWFDDYKAGTDREIPVVILEPTGTHPD